VLDENGKLRTVTMGSYGVGVSRAVACVAEGNHDELGLIWPRALAPADVHVVVTGKDETVATYGEELTRALEAQGVSVLLDDRRQASPGVKFKDAELIGVPTIVVIGRGLAQGVIEVKDRRTGERREVAVDAAVQEILAEIGQA
jgi:prolyl-tRNA synthetase